MIRGMPTGPSFDCSDLLEKKYGDLKHIAMTQERIAAYRQILDRIACSLSYKEL